MNLRDVRWYLVYGLTAGLMVWGVWRLLAPWGYASGFVLGFLLTQGAAALVGFVLHEGLHLWAALTLEVQR